MTVLFVSLIISASAFANTDLLGKACDEKNVELFIVKSMEGHQATKSRVKNAFESLRIFKKYKWDVFFLASDSDLKLVEDNITLFLPYPLQVALSAETGVDKCYSKECQGASAFNFTTHNAGIICMNNKVIVIAKTFDSNKELVSALADKYGKSTTNSFKLKETRTLSSPTKERTLTVNSYSQSIHKILHLNDVSYMVNGSKYETNQVYYLDVAEINSLYVNLKNMKADIETIRAKKRKEYDQKKKDSYKDKI